MARRSRPSCISWNTMRILQGVVQTMFQRRLDASRNACTATIEDYTRVLVPDEHRDILTKAHKLCHPDGIASQVGFNGQELPLQLYGIGTIVTRLHGKVQFPQSDTLTGCLFPKVLTLNVDQSPDASERVMADITRVSTAFIQCGAVEQALKHLQHACSSTSQLKMVLPQIVRLYRQAPDLMERADKIEEQRGSDSIPSLSPEFMDLARFAGKAIDTTLMYDKDVMPDKKVASVVRIKPIIGITEDFEWSNMSFMQNYWELK